MKRRPARSPWAAIGRGQGLELRLVRGPSPRPGRYRADRDLRLYRGTRLQDCSSERQAAPGRHPPDVRLSGDGRHPVVDTRPAPCVVQSTWLPVARRLCCPAKEMRQLLGSIDTTELMGLRDRALLGLMGYTFARVSAVVTLRVEDYFQQGRRSWLRLHEKGGKRHEVPCHHSLDEYLDGWIAAAGIGGDKKGPLFRTFKRGDKLTDNAMIRSDVLYMIKRRAKGAGLPYSTCCHTFRATGITAYLQNGGTLEHAQQIAAHQSPRTTKLYDRTKDEISLDEVERIKF